MQQRYKISIEYDGTHFFGWQKQPRLVTIQQTLEHAIYQLTQQLTEVYGAGRTDKGVHANGQIAHFDLNQQYDCWKLQNGINHYLKTKAVAIYNVEYQPASWHARFSAIQRTYQYKILIQSYPSILLNKKVHWITQSLNILAMQKASNLLIGTHDFSTFRATKCQAQSPIKTIDSIKLIQQNNLITITISAPSFLYHQVRNIIGSLILVGKGKWTISDFEYAFAQKNRIYGGPTAPAYGLYLDNIQYLNQ